MSEKTFSVGRATAIIGILTLLSRLVGLLRLQLFASKFGAGDILDIYYASFRIPDFIFNLLVLGTLSVAFIPVFSQYLTKDRKEALRVANSVLNISLLAMFALCLILFLGAGPLVKLMVPGFSPEKTAATVMLTRLMLVSPIIFTISNIVSSVLMSYKRFFLVNLAAIFYNIGIILGLEFLYPHFGLAGIGFGVVLGACLHLLIQLPGLIKTGFSWQPIMDWRNRGVQKIGSLFLPKIFSMDPSQISLIIGSIIGSTLSAGSIAVFNYANDLQAAPLGIFAVSTAVAVFPVLSERFAHKDMQGFLDSLKESIVQILFFMLPLSILILLFRAYIVRLILGHGNFNWDNTILTFNTLGIFAFSLFSQSLVPLFSRAFFARHNTKIPVIIGLISVAINIIFSYYLARTLGIQGVALGFTIASIVNCLVLFSILRLHLSRDGASARLLKIFDTGLLVAISKILIATIVMGAVSYGCIYLIAPLVNTRSALGIFIQSGVAVAAGAAAYGLVGHWIGLHQAATLVSFAAKFFRRSEVSPDNL